MILFKCKKALIVEQSAFAKLDVFLSGGPLKGTVLLCKWSIILAFYCLVFYCVMFVCCVCLYFVLIITFITEVLERPSGEDSP